ncbi:MAG: hypothetical protein R2857_10825 [Vampirovibrionales bacterium]
MTADASRPAGWFSATVAQVEPGQSYGFVIDDERQVPDPASRWQPDDVHCGSVVVGFWLMPTHGTARIGRAGLLKKP